MSFPGLGTGLLVTNAGGGGVLVRAVVGDGGEVWVC